MGSLMKREAEKFLREKKRHRRWLAIVLCLALLVSSGTFAALRMNGRAMDGEGKVLACQYQPHVHREECYGENNELICGQADYVVHQHSMECYDAQGSQVCPLEERLPHVHDSSCYIEEDILTCELEESEGHQHTEECYGWDGAAICGYAEGEGSHQHTEECCSKESRLVCGELELHTHDDTCYGVEGNLICGKTELKEHVHNEECFIEVENQAAEADNGGENPEEMAPEESQAQTHVHDESCYEEAKIPACGQEESNGHQHAEECYGEDKTLICGQEEGEGAHQHTDACYSVERTLICGYTGAEDGEETVSQEGSGASETPAAKQLQYHVPEDNVIITVEAQAGVLPDNAGLKVVPIRAEEKETQEQYESVKERLEEQAADEPYDIAGFLAYDISIMDGETEIEPSGEVKVTMDYQNAAIPEEIKEEAAKEESISQVEVVHLKETDGDVTAEKLDNAEVALTNSAEVEKAEFVTDSFSTFVLTWTKVDSADKVLFQATSNIHAVKIIGSQYEEFTQKVEAKTLSAIGTPPTLYMDSISSTGKNSEFYEIKEGETTYRFQNAYIAKKIENGIIKLDEAVPVIVLQAMNVTSDNEGEIKIRYLLEDEGEYKNFDENKQDILFAYTTGELTTTGRYYTEDGQQLNDNGQYDFSAENSSFATVSGCCVTKDKISECSPSIALTLSKDKTSYSYSYITIQKGEQVIEPTFLRYYDPKVQDEDDTEQKQKKPVLQYSTAAAGDSAREWKDVGTGEIRLIYKLKAGTVVTENTAGIVDIDLFKYKEYAYSSWGDKTNPSGYPKGDDEKTTPAEKGLQFVGYFQGDSSSNPKLPWLGVDNSKNKSYYAWNVGTDKLNTTNGTNTNCLVLQGIVQSTLEAGYPRMAFGDRSSLAGLFQSPIDSGSLVKNGYDYTGLNHLFQRDSEGYYYYNSAKNFAYLNRENGNTENRNFTVYDKPGENLNQPQANHETGNFFPFIDINDTMRDWNSGNYKSSYHFGLHISFDFIQPEKGKIGNKDMEFQFSGDDDVWVFIDNQLVLDLGGCHSAATGTINFSSGAVEVGTYKDNVYHKGALTTTEQSPTNTTQFTVDTNGTSIQKIFGNIFEDNTSHHLDFFYLERGRSRSNCSIKFNLQPQKKQTIEIGKKVVSDQAKYGDTKFKFKLYLEKNKDLYKQNNKADAFELIPQGTEYQIKEDGELTGETGTVGANGVFELMHNQSAVFSNIDPELHYYVQEVSVASSEFDVVQVPGMNIVYSNDKGGDPSSSSGKLEEGQENIIAESDIKKANEKSRIFFENTCSGHNRKTLSIRKELDASTVSLDAVKGDTYTFQVYLEDGLRKELVPYVGNYYLKDSDGKYIDLDGKPVEALSGVEPPVHVLAKENNGEIRGIKAGYSVEIRDILSGTDFFIREIGIGDNYDMPEETVSGNSAAANESGLEHPAVPAGGQDSTSEGVYGVVDLNADVSVTITNCYKKAWKIAKRNRNSPDTYLKDAEFELAFSKDSTKYYGKSTEEGYVEWYKNKAGDGTLSDTLDVAALGAGTYTLTEVKAPANYALSTEKWKIEIGTGGRLLGITVDGSDNVSPSSTEISDTESRIPCSIFYFDNTMAYELPSTGSTGIYWYLVSGMLLMMASALIIYRNRAREVVGK